MSQSNLFIFIILMSLLLLSKRAVAEDNSVGFHGYERDALLTLKAGFNNSFLDRNWTGIMCYMNEPPYWHGVQCLNGRVRGVTLENMGLVGEINVDSLVNLTELTTLTFKNNSISGNMMDFMYSRKLINIDLSGNSFIGEIPSSLLNLDSLESLNLENNKLTGPIPGFNQSTLQSFNVSNNNLSGEVPETKTLQSFGFSSYLGNENLCGPPTPTLCTTLRESNSGENPGKKSKNHELFAAVIVVVDVVVLVVILFLLIIYYKKYKKLKTEIQIRNNNNNNNIPLNDEHGSTIIERSNDRNALDGGERGKLVFLENNNSNNGAIFELDDLLKASAEGLGNGNFGNCYKAMLAIGEVVVVKKLRDLKPMNGDEFVRKVIEIAEQKHPNLMPLLGYYYSKNEKLFLYRFASSGNLHNRLHGGRGTRDRVPFRWSSRLAAARGVGRALQHLHLNSGRSQTTAPHGNLKSSNVLLDENDETLVSDYGLAALIAAPIAAQRMAAYKCPEYQSRKRISEKSDVWSYGGLLLELLTGRIPAHSAAPGAEGVDLCSWVHRAVREEWTAEIFDAEIAVQSGANNGMLRLMQIAMKCCEKSPEKRPEISQVVAEVEEIKGGGRDSEDDEYSSYSSLDRSVTDDSWSATPSLVIGDAHR
ncbi:hypothetical protein ABFS83_14G095300 [Erythranthe nasuta]